MILYWKEDKYSREVLFFNKLCGVTHKQRRPSSVEFSREEIQLITHGEYSTCEQLKNIFRVLRAGENKNAFSIII